MTVQLLLSLVCVAAHPIELGEPESESILVNIAVVTESGDPIENAPIMAYAQAPLAFGFTDAQGMLTLDAPLSDDSEEVIVALFMGGPMLSPDERALAEANYYQLRDQYHFAKFNSVPYDSNITEVSLDIVAYESVKVTGVVVSPVAKWASDMIQISVRGGVWLKRFRPGEAFEVRGVRRGHPAELFFELYEENATRIIALTSEQTQANIDLGEIQFPEIESGANINISVTSHEDLWEPGGVYPMYTRVTLISFDGQTVLCYPINPNDGKVVDDLGTVQEKMPPSIPPGVYYVCPGVFGNRTQLHLLDMIRAGRHELLVNAGVPVLGAQEEDDNTMALDAQQTRDAILAAYELWSIQ